MSKKVKTKVKKASNGENYQDWLIERLQDKEETIIYLQAALDEYQKDGNTEALLLAFRHVALAQGGVARLATKANLNRETLYRTLSHKGNPKLQTLAKLLNAFGFELMIKNKQI